MEVYATFPSPFNLTRDIPVATFKEFLAECLGDISESTIFYTPYGHDGISVLT